MFIWVQDDYFYKPRDMTVPVWNVFEAEHMENKGSKIQLISLIYKSIHWFMNEMVVTKEGHE